MNFVAIIAILLASRLVQDESGASSCRSALTALAAAAHAAEVATDHADAEVAKVSQLEAKLEGCTKSRGPKSTGCAKLELQLKEAERSLDSAEEILTLALEAVDDAYDQFDADCSWDDPDANVQVHLSRPTRHEHLRAPRASSEPDAHATATRGR